MLLTRCRGRCIAPKRLLDTIIPGIRLPHFDVHDSCASGKTAGSCSRSRTSRERIRLGPAVENRRQLALAGKRRLADERLDAMHHVDRARRLLDIVRASVPVRGPAELAATETAEHDDRHATLHGMPQPAAQLETVAVGQPEVEQHEIRRVLTRHLHPGADRAGKHDVEAVVAEHHAVQLAVVLVIVDDQDAWPAALYCRLLSSSTAALLEATNESRARRSDTLLRAETAVDARSSPWLTEKATRSSRCCDTRPSPHGEEGARGLELGAVSGCLLHHLDQLSVVALCLGHVAGGFRCPCGAGEGACAPRLDVERGLVRGECVGRAPQLHQQVALELACGEDRPGCNGMLLDRALECRGLGGEAQRF